MLVDPAPVSHLATLPFVAALALHAAIAGLDGMARHDLRLKWPNDLLLNGAKVSGILLEVDHLQDGHAAVAIGFGVNLAHHPDPALYSATDLKSLGIEVEPMAMLERLAAEFDAVFNAWDRGRKFPA